MQIEIFHVQRLTPPLDKRKTTFNDRGGGGRKVPDFVLFLEKTSVVFKKPQFSSKKPQNPSRSRKTPHLVTKPQEWERCRRHLYVCLIYRLHCNRSFRYATGRRCQATAYRLAPVAILTELALCLQALRSAVAACTINMGEMDAAQAMQRSH